MSDDGVGPWVIRARAACHEPPRHVAPAGRSSRLDLSLFVLSVDVLIRVDTVSR